jgi:IclR family acetate operon transcriptional repressor
MSTPRNQSVIKAFRMLKSFSRPDEWLTSSELSRRAGLPEASGYRLIQTLEELGAVVRGPRGRYRPGMLLSSLSRNVDIGNLLHESSQGMIVELARQLDVTLHMGLLEDGMVTYVSKVATPTSFSSHTQLGSQLEAYCSGLGKVLLAALPESELDRFIAEGDLIALTPHTITDPAVLRAHLAEIRLSGFATDDREVREDMCCIAVPIVDAQGSIIAAISATERADRMVPERQTALRGALRQASCSITRKVFPADLPPAPRIAGSATPRPLIREMSFAIHGNA